MSKQKTAGPTVRPALEGWQDRNPQHSVCCSHRLRSPVAFYKFLIIKVDFVQDYILTFLHLLYVQYICKPVFV